MELGVSPQQLLADVTCYVWTGSVWFHFGQRLGSMDGNLTSGFSVKGHSRVNHLPFNDAWALIVS